jgi:hypothetical protein
MPAVARVVLCLLLTVPALAQSVAATVDISMSGFTVYSCAVLPFRSSHW